MVTRIARPEQHDLNLEIAAGTYAGYSAVNKFGRAPSGGQTTATDVWDRADATPTQQVWTAPTQARVHAIVSTDDTDGKTGSPNSVAARTLRVYGLTSWDSAEVSEDITLTGTDAVNTTNSYVIIHRMKVLTHGATAVNAGVISATAATDGTVTAAIVIGQGQTQMAIYGVPSTQTAYMTNYYGSAIKAAAACRGSLELFVNPIPDTEEIKFLVKHTNGWDTTATSYVQHNFRPYFKIDGPAIIKIQTISSAADTDFSAGFDLILVDN
jgi:hypothetical protein